MSHRQASIVWRSVLFAIAMLAALNWVGQLFTTPNQRLVDLVADLSHQQTFSNIMASALIATSVLLAAILVPLMTLFAVYRHERQLPPAPPPPQLAVVQRGEALPPGAPANAVAHPDVLAAVEPAKPGLQAHPSAPPTTPC